MPMIPPLSINLPGWTLTFKMLGSPADLNQEQADAVNELARRVKALYVDIHIQSPTDDNSSSG